MNDEGVLIGTVLNLAVRDVAKVVRRVDDLSVLQSALKVADMGGYKTKARVILGRINKLKKMQPVKL